MSVTGVVILYSLYVYPVSISLLAVAYHRKEHIFPDYFQIP